MNFNIAVCIITCFRSVTRQEYSKRATNLALQIQIHVPHFRHDRTEDSLHAEQKFHLKIQHPCPVFSSRHETRYSTRATNLTLQNPTPELCALRSRAQFPKSAPARQRNTNVETGRQLLLHPSHRKRMRWCHVLATHNTVTELLLERGDSRETEVPWSATHGRTPHRPRTHAARSQRHTFSNKSDTCQVAPKREQKVAKPRARSQRFRHSAQARVSACKAGLRTASATATTLHPFESAKSRQHVILQLYYDDEKESKITLLMCPVFVHSFPCCRRFRCQR